MKTFRRTILALVLLGGLVAVGAMRVGPVPPLGTLLDPAHGAWALARTANLGDGVSSIPGLTGAVEVRYDRRGVPHIFATNEPDAYRALGYVVARDRLFQLWIQTMAASGRLTEIAGPAALSADREMRRLAIPWSAERKIAALDSTPESATLIRAYADGVNAYIDRMSPDELPLEFRLLGIARAPHWAPVSSALLFNRMGWTLSYLTPEVSRALAASRVGAAAATALFPDNSPIQEPIQPNGHNGARYDFTPLPAPGTPDTGTASMLAAAANDFMPASGAEARSRMPDDDPRLFSSNNWAVSPKRSATGNALLAGDPHLELTVPSIWYEAHLVVAGGLDVYGVTIPGAPGIVIGFNRDLAWSLTNTGADVLDFYTETVDDAAQPARYQVDGEWRPLERRIEQYRGTRGEIIGTDTIYFTRRGPMRREHGRWLSMRWTVLERSNEPFAFQMAAKARSVDEFQRAMGRWFWSPAQNMVVADRHGSIGIRSTGRFPVRPGGASGTAIRDGSKSESDWRGYLPPEFAPQARDPEQGYVASANQQPIDPKGAPYWLGGEYDPWRAIRINQLLRANAHMTVDAMRAMQTDPGSARADYFMPYYLAAGRDPVVRRAAGIDTARLREAVTLLGEWDRRYTRENTRAVLFEAALRETVRRTWDELLVTGSTERVATPGSAVLAELFADSANVWWDDRRTPGTVETRDDILAASLVAALDSTRAHYGSPAGKGWTWSRIRRANLWHPLRLKSLSALELPVQGGPSTLSPSSGSGIFGPSWRMVVDASPSDLAAWGTYPGGQSGNPASARYLDHLPRWLAGELEPLVVPRWIPDLSEEATSSRLTLRPR